ncbi:MAG TPA: hypothetical protein VFU15_03740 [Bacteroidia bacterium]|nr:hypothetical protein [Bacteroidia bacterium]
MTPGKNIHRLFVIVFMTVLLIPLAQECTRLIRLAPLDGAFVPAKKPLLSVSAFWNGTYQDSFETWQNENFGCRNFYVRFHNQLQYELFHKASVDNVTVGLQDYIYENQYITTTFGEDFIGDEAIGNVIYKLKCVQDTLAKMNKTFVLVICPGKGTYYPEYIPFKKPTVHWPTNYEVFTDKLKNSGLNYIDFSSWFRAMKDTSKAPLIPKTGSHWSVYGSMLALDSFIRYVEVKRNVDLPDLQLHGFTWKTSNLTPPDEDVCVSMNLLWNIRPLPMAYPDYSFGDATGKAKLNLMAVSDSYFWIWNDAGIGRNCFHRSEFWYYDQHVYYSDNTPEGNALDLDDVEATKNNDVIILMATEPNLSGLGWNYINDVYDRLVLKKVPTDMDKRIREVETGIRKSPEWMKSIVEKAAMNKISIDSMIYLDAKYVIEQQDQKK